MMNTSSLSAAALLTLSSALFAQPSLTIYNQNFAVVRDEVPLDLKAGTQTAIYRDATSTMEPDSVILRDPSGKVQLQILEQSYRNDPVTQEFLLSLFEGKEIEFQTYTEGKPEIVRGKVIRSGFVRTAEQPSGSTAWVAPIVEVGGKLQFSLPGTPLFPALGDDTVLKPQLEWKLNASEAGSVKAEVGYITEGLSWKADYNLVAPDKGNKVDIIGWITMENRSGKVFENATVKLLAGDVNRAPKLEAQFRNRGTADMMVASAAAPVVTEKAFDDFRLYTLANPVTLRDSETKQVEFIRATGVEAKRLYIYDPMGRDWRVMQGHALGEDADFGTSSDKKVTVVREFKNTKENGLGIPLPKGKLRFYQQDGDRQLEFTGENQIDHTPRNETVRVVTGNAFDVVGERLRTNWKVDSSRRTATESIEIKVRNRKDEPVEVLVKEHLPRWSNWEVKEKSAAFEKKSASEIEFKLPLKPDEEGVITYTVVYTW